MDAAARTKTSENTEANKSRVIFYVPEATDFSEKTVYRAVKRIMDLVSAVVLLFVLLIPMAMISLIICLDSPGHPIYRQVRLGKDQRPFTMYKFRSMRLDAEEDGPQWARDNDPRCTSFGRFMRKSRIDELPQLINIIRGEMSFVGPRPERPEFYDKFDSYIVGFRQRTLVIPGITGLAQVNGGYDLKPEEKVIYDMDYIRRRSLGLDLKVLFQTVGVILGHRGAR